MKGLRILSGKLKRRRIGSVREGLCLRPILARIKKSLFDILKNRIQGSLFLDLFAGSGSVGLEALSRGAVKAVFVDSNIHSKIWILESLKKFQGEGEVHCADVLSGLNFLNSRFDLIFSGAPYVDKDKHPLYFVDKLLEIIQKDGVLKEDGWFIAQHHCKETFAVPGGWDCFRQEKYGDTMLSFFRPAGAKSGDISC